MLRLLLLMRLSRVLFLFVVNVSFSQTSCELNEVLENFIKTDITYYIDKKDVDLTTLFEDNRTKYLGFISESKKRMDFHLTDIHRDSTNLNCYLIKGKTEVYKGVSRFFSGQLQLEKQYVYSEKLDNDISNANLIQKQGFSILSYKLLEDPKLSSTGIFKGYALVSWYVDILNKIYYDDILDYYPSYSNCQFFGSWTSYVTSKVSITAWGHYRIPCSGDLDIGSAEFSPNEKYYKYGWADYKP